MQRITITDDANQVFKTTLGGQVVSISLAWQDVSKSWFFSLFNDTIICENRRITPAIFILNYVFTNFSGDFMAISESEPEAEITRNNFLTVYDFYYFTAEEKEQIKNAVI